MTPYRAFLAAWTMDRCADMLWTTILAWLAAGADNPNAQGLILAAMVAPYTMLLLLGGATTDTYGSARVATITTVAKAALLLPVLAVSPGDSVPLLLLALVACAIGAVDGFHDPAMDAWGARMQRPGGQRRASAIETILWRTGQFVGAALGGFLIGIGAVIAMAVAVSLYLAQRALLSVLKRRTLTDPVSATSETPTGTRTARQQIREGLRLLHGRPLLWAAIGTRTVCGLSMGATLLLLLPRIVREQGWSTVTYGFAAGVFGAGLAAGAGLVAYREKKGRSTSSSTVPIGAFGLTVGAHVPLLVIAAAMDSIGPVQLVLLMGLFGLALGPVTPILLGFQREQVPGQQQGIVAAAARVFINGLEPVGPLAAGFITSLGGAELALSVSASLGIITGLVAAGWAGVLNARDPGSAGWRRSIEGRTTTRR